MKTIRENISQIREAITKFSPYPERVKIEGVSKYQSIEKIREAIKEGINILGVNYAQAGKELQELLKNEPVSWHFIGHIQSRKSKLLLDYDCIESLDRLEVAQKLNELASKVEKKISVLVEVNIGNEPQKSGLKTDEVNGFFFELSKLPHITVQGLMAMPPALEPEKRRPFFKALRTLFEELSQSYEMKELSMGTSEDYQVALQEGATLIRLGSCLFGPRPNKN